MAVTTEYSDQEQVRQDDPKTEIPLEDSGKLWAYKFEFTQGSSAGDAGSLAYLRKLPPGPVNLFLPLSRVHFSAMGTGRTMDLGWSAYTSPADAAVSADPNGLDDGVDVSSAGAVVPGGTVGTDETYTFDSRDGVMLQAQINDGTIPASATLKGVWVFGRG